MLRQLARTIPFAVFLMSTALALVPSSIDAKVDVGGVAVTRYVWRGMQKTRPLTIQPYLSYSHGSFELGTWSTWPISEPHDGSENNLYAAYSTGALEVTATDYYDPTRKKFFDYGEDGVHTIEISGSYQFEDTSLFVGANVWGDPDDSIYFEFGYEFLRTEAVEGRVAVGGGNSMYRARSESDIQVVNVAVAVAKGGYEASYILNPDLETTWLVLARKF